MNGGDHPAAIAARNEATFLEAFRRKTQEALPQPVNRGLNMELFIRIKDGLVTVVKRSTLRTWEESNGG